MTPARDAGRRGGPDQLDLGPDADLDSALDPDLRDDLLPARRGAHRARPPALVGALPVIAALVVIAAVTFGVVQLISGPPEVAVPAQIEAADPTPTSSPTVTEPAPTPTETTPAIPVDRDLPVVVLNGAGISGLAGDVSEDLVELGWNITGRDNAEGEIAVTVVYTPDPEWTSTAQALAVDLGGAQVEESTQFSPDVITVVLGTDAG